MISKEEFVKIINRLKETNDFVNRINDEARKLQDAIESDFFNSMSLSISHESIVVSLLENMFDTDLISWWIYELDYGKKFKVGYLIEGDGITKPDLSTAEKLYDYLIKEK